jgi:hypothetical protein
MWPAASTLAARLLACPVGWLGKYFPPYAPRPDAPSRVLPGSSLKQHCPPEPCAQVRILLGALLKSINSNTLTILGCLGANPVTCGNAQPLRTLRPIRARKADTSLKGPAQPLSVITAARPLP